MVVTRLPPGTWKPGGPLILTGPGPDGISLWQTISHDGGDLDTARRGCESRAPPI